MSFLASCTSQTDKNVNLGKKSGERGFVLPHKKNPPCHLPAFSSQLYNSKLVVWVGGLDSWMPENERDCFSGVPPESRTTGPQITNLPLGDLQQGWKTGCWQFP